MRVANPLLSIAAATSFLTRIPVGRLVDVDGAAVARAAPIYPLVGAALGVAAGGTADVLEGPLPPVAAAAAALAVIALVTGGMHLDGVADTADALGGTNRERRLEIMRDHAIGSFGAVAVALVLLFEAALLASLAAGDDAWRALATAAACSRWAALPLAAALPYVRAEGTGAVLARTSTRSVAAGLVVALAIALLASGVDGLVALAAAAAGAAVLGAFFRRWLGGVTGDTLGATTELTQAIALAALVATA